MRFRLLLTTVCLALAALGNAAEFTNMPASKQTVRKQVIAVIDAQLAAFRAQDVTRAYAYASVGLRRRMPVAVFASVVRENYSQIWTNSRAEYGIVRDDGNTARVLVHVEGKTGAASYDYTLENENGQWRVRAILRSEGTPGTEM